MKIANILIGAMALVVLPAIAGASTAPGGDRGGKPEAMPAGSILVADIGCETCTSGFDIWQNRRMDRGTRLNQRRRHNGGNGSGRRDREDDECHMWKLGCPRIENRGGPGYCWPRPEGGWYCPGG